MDLWSRYLSAPVLSWQVGINMTKVELELILDPDMTCLYSLKKV